MNIVPGWGRIVSLFIRYEILSWDDQIVKIRRLVLNGKF